MRPNIRPSIDTRINTDDIYLIHVRPTVRGIRPNIDTPIATLAPI